MINLCSVFLCFYLVALWCLFFVFVSITKNKALLPGGNKMLGVWQMTTANTQQTPNSEGGQAAVALVWAQAWLWASLSEKQLRFLLSHISGRWLKQKFKHMRTSMNHTSSFLLHRCHLDPRIIAHQSFPGRKRGLTSQRPDFESWLCYYLTKGKSFLRVSISWSVKHVFLTDYNSLRGSTEFHFCLSPSLCIIFYIK